MTTSITSAVTHHIRKAEAIGHLIAAANRMESGSITVPSDLFDALVSTPGARVYSAESGTIVEIRVGRVSISAVRLHLPEVGTRGE